MLLWPILVLVLLFLATQCRAAIAAGDAAYAALTLFMRLL
jgi:hypothetical protein